MLAAMYCSGCGVLLPQDSFFCSFCGRKVKSNIVDSIPIQLKDNTSEKTLISHIFKRYNYSVIVLFLRLYHNIEISHRTLKRRLNKFGLKRKCSETTPTDHELRNLIESEIQGPSSQSTIP